jgi:hypothetical protein
VALAFRRRLGVHSGDRASVTQLVGFIVGGAAGYILFSVGVWLTPGAPKGERSAIVLAPMLCLGPVGFLVVGYVGMRLICGVVKRL